MFQKPIFSSVSWIGVDGPLSFLQISPAHHQKTKQCGWRESLDQASNSASWRHSPARKDRLLWGLLNWLSNNQANGVTWHSHVWRHIVWVAGTGTKSCWANGQEAKWTKRYLEVFTLQSGIVFCRGILISSLWWEGYGDMIMLGVRE